VRHVAAWLRLAVWLGVGIALAYAVLTVGR
jgi:hypothetical protein